ncbi:hypothetical protein KAS41_03590 [Candidatus Parcubacteria bacterium]|nr:hypothetical protein [Candidatus Parcubacteria bacterium]
MKNIHGLIFLIGIFLLASMILFYAIPLACYQEIHSAIENPIIKIQDSEKSAVYIKSDKKIYNSGDNMRLVIDLKNFTIEDILKIQVVGIKTSRGNFALNKIREVEIKENPYRVVFDVKLPSCSKCAGIAPGKYSIQVNILRKGEVVKNEVMEIELL